MRRRSRIVTVGLPSARRPSWPPGKLPKPRLAKPNVRRGKRPRQADLPSRRREKRRKLLSGRRSSPHAERGGKRKSDVRGGDRRPSFGKTRASRRATQRMRRIDCASMLCFGPPDPPFHPAWQRAVGIPPGLQQNARCIDSDGVAPLVEALDRDCSLAGFDGGAMHFGSLTFVFSDLAHDPCPKRRPGKNGRRFYQWRPCAAVVFGCAPSMQPRDR